MRLAVVLALLTVGVAIGPGMSAAAQSEAKTLPPQARPVLVWLSAVKNGDQDALKTAFSEPMRQRFDQEGWAKVLRRTLPSSSPEATTVEM